MPRLTVRLPDVRTSRLPRVTASRLPRVLLAALFVAGPVTFLDAPAAHAAAHQVVMSGYAFAPRTLTITAGDTVTWVNQDTAPHDVKTTSGPDSIHSPMLNKGGTFSHTFTVAGSYGYVCTVHPGMTAQLVVKAAVAPKPTTQPPSTQHHTSAPARATSPSVPAQAAASAHPHESMSSAAAAPAASSAAPSSADTSAPAGQAQAPIAADNAASTVRPLDPLLVLAGVVAGIAVLCLLLVGSRSAATARGDSGADEN
ncbi:plastocyanin/azurin family copper-binding protein [Streptomyces sp. NPDC048324]|uniref:plastocyanin/azurin family copper-binding protein n=1 Tax=Streptomyces sp. NPDC048324 TaxID=3157205 RepID=UPI0034472ACE